MTGHIRGFLIQTTSNKIFPEKIRGTYYRNIYSLILISLAIVFLCFTHFKNISWAGDIDNIGNLLVFYGITFIIVIAILKVLNLSKVQIIITDKILRFTFDKSKWTEINIDEIQSVYHEGGRIDVKINDNLIEIPPFGFNVEMKLLRIFKDIGIEVISYSSD